MNFNQPTSDEFIDEVIDKYSDMVYKIAFSQTKNKEDSDDIFQKVFLQVVKNTKPFQSEEHLKAWLIRTTLNFCKKLWASAWNRHTVELNIDIPFEMEEQSDLYTFVLKLPDKYRIVIHLFYYEDMSITQISNALNIKENTIKSHLRRGRDLLKEKLQGDELYYV